MTGHPASTRPPLGLHIAHRLVELGCDKVFAVAGDFNLLLLDQVCSCICDCTWLRRPWPA